MNGFGRSLSGFADSSFCQQLFIFRCVGYCCVLFLVGDCFYLQENTFEVDGQENQYLPDTVMSIMASYRVVLYELTV